MEKAKLSSLIICSSTNKFRGGETVPLDIVIKNTGTITNNFGVKVIINREGYSSPGCGASGDLSVNSETTMHAFWTAESYTYDRYKYNVTVEIYSNSDCSGFLLDSVECTEMIDVWPTITLFKGEIIDVNMSCSADKDRTHYRKMMKIGCFKGDPWSWPPPDFCYPKEITYYDSDWLCCVNKNETVHMKLNITLPISTEQEGNYLQLIGAIFKWAEEDPWPEGLHSCQGSGVYIYGGER